MTLKLSLKDLKKAITHLEANSRDLSVRLSWEPEKAKLSASDKRGNFIEITLFDERVNSLPTITESKTL